MSAIKAHFARSKGDFGGENVLKLSCSLVWLSRLFCCQFFSFNFNFSVASNVIIIIIIIIIIIAIIIIIIVIKFMILGKIYFGPNGAFPESF